MVESVEKVRKTREPRMKRALWRARSRNCGSWLLKEVQRASEHKDSLHTHTLHSRASIPVTGGAADLNTWPLHKELALASAACYQESRRTVAARGWGCWYLWFLRPGATSLWLAGFGAETAGFGLRGLRQPMLGNCPSYSQFLPFLWCFDCVFKIYFSSI